MDALHMPEVYLTGVGTQSVPTFERFLVIRKKIHAQIFWNSPPASTSKRLGHLYFLWNHEINGSYNIIVEDQNRAVYPIVPLDTPLLYFISFLNPSDRSKSWWFNLFQEFGDMPLTNLVVDCLVKLLDPLWFICGNQIENLVQTHAYAIDLVVLPLGHLVGWIWNT
jgi:hypothetical protein